MKINNKHIILKYKIKLINNIQINHNFKQTLKIIVKIQKTMIVKVKVTVNNRALSRIHKILFPNKINPLNSLIQQHQK